MSECKTKSHTTHMVTGDKGSDKPALLFQKIYIQIGGKKKEKGECRAKEKSQRAARGSTRERERESRRALAALRRASEGWMKPPHVPAASERGAVKGPTEE